MSSRETNTLTVEHFVGDGILAKDSIWSFSGEKVAESFYNHAKKSIPLYACGHNIITKISDYFAVSLNEKIHCYDLGCSTGELTYVLADRHKLKKNISWIGIDNEIHMTSIAQKKKPGFSNLCYEHKDVLNYSFEKSSFFICYYLLQFLSYEQRECLLKKISNSLCVGGGVVIFEKVHSMDAYSESMFSHILFNDKIKNGLKIEECFYKLDSLKGVLRSKTSAENKSMFLKCGFKKCYKLLQYLNFEGYLLLKD